MKIPFSKEQIIDRLEFENPWWLTANIDKYYQTMKRREYFKLFYPLVIEQKVKRAVVLMGPRRVGKTVLLFQTIQELIDTKQVDAKKICYLSIETPIYNGISLEELVTMFREINAHKDHSGLYIIFDEIQYLKDWEVHLKSLVDSYHDIKFIVSGSAAAALKLKSNESGAGRFTDFILPPLTFHEYISLLGKDDLIITGTDSRFRFFTSDIESLNRHFIDYINYGGYPEVTLSETARAEASRYIRNDIIDKVLLRDLPSLYGIQDIQELNSLFTYIAYNSGNEMSLDTISKHSGVAKNTIKKYISYLEAAFLIKIIDRVDNDARKFKRANFFKIYLTNPSLRCALFSPLNKNDDFMGNMVETAIFSQWQHNEFAPLHYARWNDGEIDIVLVDSVQKVSGVVEVKWTNRHAENINELKNVKQFCIKHKVKRPTITTIDIDRIDRIDNIEYEFAPASIYCYSVGRTIIEQKKKKNVL